MTFAPGAFNPGKTVQPVVIRSVVHHAPPRDLCSSLISNFLMHISTQLKYLFSILQVPQPCGHGDLDLEPAALRPRRPLAHPLAALHARRGRIPATLPPQPGGAHRDPIQ